MYWLVFNLLHAFLSDLVRSISGKIRGIFHYRHTSMWAAGLWLGAFFAMTHETYWLAIGGYIAGTVWVVGWWLVEHPAPKSSKTLTSKQRKRRWYRWSVPTLVVFITALLILYTLHLRDEYLRSQYAGYLEAASDPLSGCARDLKDGDIVITYGKTSSVIHKFPHCLIKSRSYGALLSIDRAKDGRIVVLSDIRSRDGKIVARLNADGFIVNQNNSLQMKRDDRSTLRVIDEEGDEVLNIRYGSQRDVVVRARYKFGDQERTFPVMAGDGYELTEGICFVPCPDCTDFVVP